MEDVEIVMGLREFAPVGRWPTGRRWRRWLERFDLEKACTLYRVAGSPQVPGCDIRRLELRIKALERRVESIKTDPAGRMVGGQLAPGRGGRSRHPRTIPEAL